MTPEQDATAPAQDSDAQPADEAAPAAPAPGATASTAELSPEARLEEAQAQAQQNWDRYLRTAAELDNLRRRSQQEVEKARKFAIERFAAEMLDVRDSLEMGLAAASESPTVEALNEGTRATLKQLTQAFEKFGVSEVEALGEPFDPAVHEAMTVQETDDGDVDRVSMVIQKGYLLNGRLLRPARVMVARPRSDNEGGGAT